MENQQYTRQKLYYRWSLILCILALIGYSLFFLYERYVYKVPLFDDNISFYMRFTLIIYFSILLIYLNSFPQKIFNLIGFFIAVPLGWMISIISYLTIGFEGITVTGFIFLILSSAVVFNFGLKSFIIALTLIISFHFSILSFYQNPQPVELTNHIFLLGLSCILGITINYLINIIKKNETKALKEREMLLKEIHHRVKNNLQVISSLLNLQAGTITDSATKAVVLESQARVKTMAFIHQLLYESENLTNINFEKYLNQLMASLHGSFKSPGKDIKYTINVKNIELNIDKAVPLGLITNELVTNAYKYAFINSNDGKIEIELIKKQGNQFLLKVSDNGKGFPKNFDLEKKETLGLKLVKLLTSQIDGKIEIINENGATFLVNFKDTPTN